MDGWIPKTRSLELTWRSKLSEGHVRDLFLPRDQRRKVAERGGRDRGELFNAFADAPDLLNVLIAFDI